MGLYLDETQGSASVVRAALRPGCDLRRKLAGNLPKRSSPVTAMPQVRRDGPGRACVTGLDLASKSREGEPVMSKAAMQLLVDWG